MQIGPRPSTGSKQYPADLICNFAGFQQLEVKRIK